MTDRRDAAARPHAAAAPGVDRRARAWGHRLGVAGGVGDQHVAAVHAMALGQLLRLGDLVLGALDGVEEGLAAAGHQQQQGRAQTFAASGDDVARHLADQWNARVQTLGDDVVHLAHVRLDQRKGGGGAGG